MEKDLTTPLIPSRNLARHHDVRKDFQDPTIHPKPFAGCRIPELLVEPKFLVKYEIPGAEKKRIRGDLASLGITEKAVLPGLDALSRVLIEEQHTIGYSPPDPPNFHFSQAAS